MHRHAWWLCAVAIFVLGSASQASARDWDRDYDRDPTRIYGGVWLGFGGDIEVDGVGRVGDLGKTIGGQAGVDVLVSRWFSLGGEVRVGGFDVDGWDKRSRLIDLDFKPRLYLPLNAPVEIYAAVPVGLTIPRLADIEGGPRDENIGWNIGVGPGINVFLTRSFGLNVEPMWLFHHFGLDGTDGNDAVTVKQFAIMINGLFAL